MGYHPWYPQDMTKRNLPKKVKYFIPPGVIQSQTSMRSWSLYGVAMRYNHVLDCLYCNKGNFHEIPWVDQSPTAIPEMKDIYEPRSVGVIRYPNWWYHNPPLSEEESGWVYIQQIKDPGFIDQLNEINYTSQLDMDVFKTWYDSVTPCTEYGLGKYCWDSDGNPRLRN